MFSLSRTNSPPFIGGFVCRSAYVVAICSHPSSSLATFIVLTYPQPDEIFCLLLILAAPPLDTRPCISRFALGPGFVYRKVAMLTQRSCCLLQRLSAAGPSLGSELAGTMLCGLQLLLSSVSHTRQLTFAPRTPAPPRKQLSRTSALARVGYGGMYPGRGQMSSTSSDDGGAYRHAPLNM